MKHVLWGALVLVGCASSKQAETRAPGCAASYARFDGRGRSPMEVRVTLRKELLACLDANDPQAAATVRQRTHAEFLKVDLEDALTQNDVAKMQPLFTEWANSGGATLNDFSRLRGVEHLRDHSWARPWISRITTSSMAMPRSDLPGWGKWLASYYGKSDVDLRVATALGEQSRGRLALWQGHVLKARIDADATWMVVEEFVPSVVLRGQSVTYYDVQNQYLEQREPRGLFFLVRIPGNDERYARYDYVVVLGEISGAREKKGTPIDQVAWEPVSDEVASLPVVDAWDVTPKGPTTWAEPVQR